MNIYLVELIPDPDKGMPQSDMIGAVVRAENEDDAIDVSGDVGDWPVSDVFPWEIGEYRIPGVTIERIATKVTGERGWILCEWHEPVSPAVLKHQLLREAHYAARMHYSRMTRDVTKAVASALKGVMTTLRKPR